MSGKNWSTTTSYSSGGTRIESRAGSSALYGSSGSSPLTANLNNGSVASNIIGSTLYGSGANQVGNLVGNNDILSNLNNYQNNINQLFKDIIGSSRQDYNNALYRDIMREQNEYNTNSARQAMKFSEDMANRQMAFQKEMSDTSYQRAVADLKKAGLNPSMAYFTNGASTPSGSSASGVALSSAGAGVDTNNGLTSVLSSMINAAPMLLIANALSGLKGNAGANKIVKGVGKIADTAGNAVGDFSNFIGDIFNNGYNALKGFFSGHSSRSKQLNGPFNGGTR